MSMTFLIVWKKNSFQEKEDNLPGRAAVLPLQRHFDK